MNKSLVYKPWFFIIIIALDITVALLSYYGSYFIRSNIHLSFFIHDFDFSTLRKIPLEFLLPLQIIFLYFFGAYDPTSISKPGLIFKIVFISVILQVLTIAGYLVYFVQEQAPRSILVLYPVLDILLLFILRYYISHFFVASQEKRVVLIGIHKTTANIIQEIEKNQWLNTKIVGIIDTDNYTEDTYEGYPVIGNKDEILHLIDQFNIDNIILINEEEYWKDKIIMSINNCFKTKANIYIVPSFYELMLGKLKYYRIHDIPMIEVAKDPNSPLRIIFKRVFDLLLSSFFIIAFLPFFLLIGILIKLTSKGPIFFFQERYGKDLCIFNIVKFRTMIVDAEKETGAIMAIDDDPRITKIGNFLRKTRLDELPQLFNILIGHMSFIGPRPERPFFVNQFKEEIQEYVERFKVKPGLTGLAQIHGDYRTSPQNKLRYDLTYIYNYSIIMDIIIILQTIKIILTKKGN